MGEELERKGERRTWETSRVAERKRGLGGRTRGKEDRLQNYNGTTVDKNGFCGRDEENVEKRKKGNSQILDMERNLVDVLLKAKKKRYQCAGLLDSP
ncbi:hypothetical protein M8J75_012258 [Diaphorina citri]|nr:hypothetical protein M8J75_012258 [Diaphorina citri]